MSIYAKIADSHPKLKRGIVTCRKCGASLKVDSSECLRRGWPQCCGETMSLDSPKPSDALLSARANGAGK